MSTIAVMGVDGALGSRLLATLDSRPGPGRPIVLDHLDSRLVERSHPPLTADPVTMFTDVDVLVYLGAGYDRTPGLDRATELTAMRRALIAAHEAGVAHIVVVSSVLAYGAHPDNDLPLTESSPLRGIEDFDLAEHARDVELLLADWMAHTPDAPQVAVLRCAPLLGPGIDSWLTRALEAPRIPAVKGHRPPLQFLHPDDALTAIVHAVGQRLSGTYNVAADGWLSFDEMTAIVGRGVVDVPEEVAYRSVQSLWSLGLGDQRPGIIEFFSHPCVMSSEALTNTGWRPRNSNRDAVAAMAAEHRPYLTLGPVRTRRATVGWTAVAAAVATLVAAWAAWRSWSSWRGRRAARADRAWPSSRATGPRTSTTSREPGEGPGRVYTLGEGRDGAW